MFLSVASALFVSADLLLRPFSRHHLPFLERIVLSCFSASSKSSDVVFGTLLEAGDFRLIPFCLPYPHFATGISVKMAPIVRQLRGRMIELGISRFCFEVT
jgi:hypothetical protein